MEYYRNIQFDRLQGGWYEVFKKSEDELINIFNQLEKLENEQHKIIYPLKEDIFNAFYLTPLDKIKVVIIGQDPYHSCNSKTNLPTAMGLSFSVKDGDPIPPSLRNIFTEIKSNIEDFTIPKSGNLTGWTSQGIFLLNSCLTVEAHCPGSHCGKYMLWTPFIRDVLKAISIVNPTCIFLLWGKDAQTIKKYIGEKSIILESAHPSPFSYHKGFEGCKHFSKVNKLLKYDPINWNL